MNLIKSLIKQSACYQLSFIYNIKHLYLLYSRNVAPFIYICLLLSVKFPSYLSLPPSLPPSLVLSQSKRNMVGNQKTKQSPSSSTKAKPEITAPILQSFPPLLPPATACDATNMWCHSYMHATMLSYLSYCITVWCPATPMRKETCNAIRQTSFENIESEGNKMAPL